MMWAAALLGFANKEDDDEEDQEKLEKWRPQGGDLHGHAKRKKQASSKSDDSSDHESQDGGSDAQSQSSEGASDVGSESSGDKSEKDSDNKSEGTGADEDGDSVGVSEADADEAEGKKDEAKRNKRTVMKMEFLPLLKLHEPLGIIMEEPAEMFAHGKKRKSIQNEQAQLDEFKKVYRNIAKAAQDWMAEMGLEECKITELALVLGKDTDELRFMLEQSNYFTVDDEGLVKKTVLLKIFEVMESDIETFNEVRDRLPHVDEVEIRQAVKNSGGELRIKLANEIELIEHVDLEAELKLQREQDKEKRKKDKADKAKRRRGKKKQEEEDEEDGSSSEDEDSKLIGQNKEAEKKALNFRRAQVQRKIEEFLKAYTAGQNLTKINARGKRYHRRVYVDTHKKALVVQGASGPKFFPFSSMKEVDIETRTTQEGRVETLVICAIEKGGRIVKELNLSFPDQAKASTFVNCVMLFSLALRNPPRKG